MLVSLLSESFNSVKLLKATCLLVESEQNEARVIEKEYDERRREDKSFYIPVSQQLVCFRFWFKRTENMSAAISV